MLKEPKSDLEKSFLAILRFLNIFTSFSLSILWARAVFFKCKPPNQNQPFLWVKLFFLASLSIDPVGFSVICRSDHFSFWGPALVAKAGNHIMAPKVGICLKLPMVCSIYKKWLAAQLIPISVRVPLSVSTKHYYCFSFLFVYSSMYFGLYFSFLSSFYSSWYFCLYFCLFIPFCIYVCFPPLLVFLFVLL